VPFSKVGPDATARLYARVDGNGTADNPTAGCSEKAPQVGELDVRVQRYRPPGTHGHGTGHGQKEGGRLHPHIDTKQMGLVSLMSLGAPCKFFVDNQGTKTAPGCTLQTTGKCWCAKGLHWVTAKTYAAQKEQRTSAGGGWTDGRPLSCPGAPHQCDRCVRCKSFVFESGDILVFDADEKR
jgi:hypothetical protein